MRVSIFFLFTLVGAVFTSDADSRPKRLTRPSLKVLESKEDSDSGPEMLVAVLPNTNESGSVPKKNTKKRPTEAETSTEPYKVSRRKSSRNDKKEQNLAEDLMQVAEMASVAPSDPAKEAWDILVPLLNDYDSFVEAFFESTREIKLDEMESALVKDEISLLELAFEQSQREVFEFLLDYGFRKTSLSGGRSMILETVFKKRDAILDILLKYPQFKKQLCPSLILIATRFNPNVSEKLSLHYEAYSKILKSINK